MPKTPLTVTNRLEFQYSVDAFPHKMHLFLQATMGATAALSTTTPRPGGAAVALNVAIDRVWTLMGNIYDAGHMVPGNVLGETRSGSQWIVNWVYATAVAMGAVGAGPHGTVVTLIMRTATYKKVPVEFFESYVPVPWHAGALSQVYGNFTIIANYFGNASGTAGNSDPWTWLQSRGGEFMSSWQSITATTNRKIRRKRGIA